MPRKLMLISNAVLAMAILTVSVPSHAADAAEVEAKFKAADKDGDGKLTLAEAQAGMPRVAKNFDKLDADKKGYLTLDQLKVAMAK